MSASRSAGTGVNQPSLVSLEGSPTMRVIEATGSAREIGWITGEALREEIRTHLALLRPKMNANGWAQRKQALRNTLYRHTPQLLEELEATAEAAAVSFDELLYLNVEPQYGHDETGDEIGDRCTNVAFAEGPDGPVWGKNNDRPGTESPRPVCARVIQRTGQLPMVIFTYAGLLATADGMNAAGLAVGHSSVGSVFQQSDEHVPIRLWAYEGLMRCRSTEQFVHHMQARPLRGKGYSLVCVDGEGSTASLEAPCPLMQVRRAQSKPGHMHCVNLYQQPSLAHADRRPPEGKCNAQERMAWLDQRLAAPGPFDQQSMESMLRHTDRPAICRNAVPPDTSVTEYSMIGLPKQRRVLFLEGNPAEQCYQSLTFNLVDHDATEGGGQSHHGSSNGSSVTGTKTDTVDLEQLRDAIDRGCTWIQDVAQIKTDELPADTDDRMGFNYQSWRGAVRGEYAAAERRWWSFCPVWHTGQAVKALLLAAKALDEHRYMAGAQAGADFILDKQVWDPNDPAHGLILAFEDIPDQVNTSAVMEGMHGLMLLADEQNSDAMWERIIATGHFLIDRVFVPELGLFRDLYIPAERRIGSTTRFRTKDSVGGRPLLEDGVLLKLHERTGEAKFLDAHLKVAERLLADQNPPGNWLDYGPCHADKGIFHPRHTYWWGLPLIDTYRKTGREEFLQTAIASGEFCRRAMRRDGGYLRGTYRDFNTDSFGHAISGSACAAILFLRLFQETGDHDWFDAASTALSFCMKVQFRNPQDPNLKGAVLEKILPPDGTDRSPYYLRDVGTIFFVIAGVEYQRSVGE